MGQLETEVKKRKRRADIKKIILGTVAVAGILAVGAIAPNVLGAMGKLGLLPSKRQKETINRARERLLRNGLLVYKNRMVCLTQKGEQALRHLELHDFALKRPKRWDGKWRVLIFDIPEKKRRLRDRVRQTLSMIGFVRLQHSVWIYPYDCEDFITLLKADFHIGKDVLYLVVEALEYDVSFRKQFGLS